MRSVGEKAIPTPVEGCKPDIIQWLIVMPGTRYPNANFANGREWTQITPFVIPNTVRNLAGKRRRFIASL